MSDEKVLTKQGLSHYIDGSISGSTVINIVLSDPLIINIISINLYIIFY